MNKKRVFLGILLLVGLMLSGCVWYGGYGYSYGHRSEGYSHGHPDSYGRHSFRYHHYPRSGGGHHPGSGHRFYN